MVQFRLYNFTVFLIELLPKIRGDRLETINPKCPMLSVL